MRNLRREQVLALGWGESSDDGADGIPQCLAGSGGSAAHPLLELGEGLFDREWLKRGQLRCVAQYLFRDVNSETGPLRSKTKLKALPPRGLYTYMQ